MSTGRIIAAMLVSTIVTSFTDWFFFGIWMHERYRTYPEVWRRPQGGKGENRAVAWAALVSALTCVGFVGLCAIFGIRGWKPPMAAAVILWIAFPIPTMVTNTLFMKLDPILILPHGLGWLTRLALCAAVVAWLF